MAYESKVIAGEAINIGEVVGFGADGKLHRWNGKPKRAVTSEGPRNAGPIGYALRDIAEGEIMTFDWRTGRIDR